MIDEKVLNIIEQARTMAITILVCDGHDIDGFYVKDTNLIAHNMILALSDLKYNIDEQNFKDLCSSNFESIYILMKQWESLFFNIKNIEEFNTRHIHFLWELKKILNVDEFNTINFESLVQNVKSLTN